jgi:hypothetical protein
VSEFPWPNDRCPTHGSFMCANCLGVPYMPGARGGKGSLAMILAAKAAYRRACEAAELARYSDQPAPQNPPPSPTGDAE